MKKLVMLSNESVFSGVIKCGVAEVVDSLANELARTYAVSLICPDGNGLYKRAGGTFQDVEEGVRKCRFCNVDYFLIRSDLWETKVIEVVERCKPDILHNFAEPELVDKLIARPTKCVYTIDNVDAIAGKESYLVSYDSISTTSVNYAAEIMKSGSRLANVLSGLDFHGITNGIMTTAFNPANGFLIPAKFRSTDQRGKTACKNHLKQTYGITNDPYICLMMTRLVEAKNIQGVIDVIPKFKETGGILIVVGKGDEEYEKQLSSYTAADGLIYVNRWASPLQIGPLGAGSDFFLYPSNEEPCGLMPMTASRYGTVPIVTLNGGLADNFNDDNAIIICNDDIASAIERAAELYSDKDALTAKRKVCMEQDYSWTTRKAGYIELYEKERVVTDDGL